MIRPLACIACLALVACGTAPESTGPTEEEQVRPIPVHVAAVKGGVIERTLRAHGRLRETRRHRVVALADGIVAELPVRGGDAVDAGDLLVKLDPLPEFATRLAKARSAAERAARELERRKAIAAQAPEAVSGSEMDRLRDAVEDADLELAALEAQVARRTVTAPMDGVLDTVELVPGQRVNVGHTVGEIVATGSLELPVKLPETALGRLAVDQEVTVVTLDGTEAVGTVARLPSLIDPEQGTGEVLVAVADPPAGWRAGAYATAECLLERVEADRVLERKHVHYHRNRAFAWLVTEVGDDLVLKKAWLQLGSGDDDRVAITDGLSVGDRIVTDAIGIREDLLVEIAPEDVPLPGGETKDEGEDGKRDESKRSERRHRRKAGGGGPGKGKR